MFSLYELEFHFRYVKNLWNSIVDYFNQVKGLFASFKFIDAIDIFFVAIVLYLVIRIIRETRAIQLIKGVIFFAVLYFLVSFLGRGASSYILRAIFSNILLIVVVLFGPEIRNVLEQVGKGAARTSLRTILNPGVAVEANEMRKTIDATCKACVEMSDAKIGALIVFEHETLIGDIIASGTVLKAKASRELIQNIFFPKSPLHDGALIVRDGVVYAAGCILPLSHDNSISSDLGTRHRAAIGITQQSDAIAIVVSEETGAISIAKNGSLQRNLTSGDIRDILTEAFIDSTASEGGILGKLVRRNKNNG